MGKGKYLEHLAAMQHSLDKRPIRSIPSSLLL